VSASTTFSGRVTEKTMMPAMSPGVKGSHPLLHRLESVLRTLYCDGNVEGT
jgi:hypothetical protein